MVLLQGNDRTGKRLHLFHPAYLEMAGVPVTKLWGKLSAHTATAPALSAGQVSAPTAA